MTARTFKILLVIFLALLVAIPISFYIIRQTILKPQQAINQPEVAEEEIIINSPQDLEMAIQKVSPQFTDPQGSSEQLLKFMNEAENFEPSASLSAQINKPDFNIKEMVQSRKYFNIFTQLTGQYYATANPQILALAQALERFYKIKFPTAYKPEEWKIEVRPDE